MDLVLWILPKCRQGGGGGPKSRKLCRRHLSMAPYETAGKNFFGHMGRWGKISLPLTLTMKVRLTLGGYPFLATQVYFPLSCS